LFGLGREEEGPHAIAHAALFIWSAIRQAVFETLT
jgi:hypothetical protein